MTPEYGVDRGGTSLFNIGLLDLSSIGSRVIDIVRSILSPAKIKWQLLGASRRAQIP